MAMQQNLWQRQVESQFERAQARQLGLRVSTGPGRFLAEDGRGNSVDHEKEIWTLRLPAIPVEGGEVIGTIEDRQGLFNLNNVATNVHNSSVCWRRVVCRLIWHPPWPTG